MQSLTKVFYKRMIAVFCLLSMLYFDVQSQTEFKTKTEVLAYLISRKTFINEKENMLMNFSEMGNKVAIGAEKYSNPKIIVVSSSVAILEYQLFTNAQVKISLIVDARENSIMNRKSEKIFKSILTIPDQISSTQQLAQQSIPTDDDTKLGSDGWPICTKVLPIISVFILRNKTTGRAIDFDFIRDIAQTKKEKHVLKDQIDIIEEDVKSESVNCNYKGTNFNQLNGECDIIFFKDGTYLTNAVAKRGKYTCAVNGLLNFKKVEFPPLTESKTKPLNLTPALKNLVNEQNNILYAKLD